MSNNFYIGKADTSGIRRTTPPREPLKCTIENCEKKRFSLGFCQAHYRQFKRTGHLETRTKYDNTTCLIDGCINQTSRKGLCNKHYLSEIRRKDKFKI